MNAKELIKELKKLDPETVVLLHEDTYLFGPPSMELHGLQAGIFRPRAQSKFLPSGQKSTVCKIQHPAVLLLDYVPDPVEA